MDGREGDPIVKFFELIAGRGDDRSRGAERAKWNSASETASAMRRIQCGLHA